MIIWRKMYPKCSVSAKKKKKKSYWSGNSLDSFHEICSPVRHSSHVQRCGVFSAVGSCVTSAAFPLCTDWLSVPPLLTRSHTAQPEQRDSQSCPRACSAPSAHQIKMEALGVQVQRPCAFHCSRLWVPVEERRWHVCVEFECVWEGRRVCLGAL